MTTNAVAFFQAGDLVKTQFFDAEGNQYFGVIISVHDAKTKTKYPSVDVFWLKLHYISTIEQAAVFQFTREI